MGLSMQMSAVNDDTAIGMRSCKVYVYKAFITIHLDTVFEHSVVS